MTPQIQNANNSKPSILRRLRDLEQTLQQSPVSDATKEFEKDLKTLNDEYNKVPEVVAKYSDAHKEYIGTKMCSAKPLVDEAESWAAEISDKVKQVIETLKDQYSKIEEGDDEEPGLKDELETAENALNEIKSQLDQAKAEEEKKKQKFEKIKGFQVEVDNWFKNLENLHKKAKAYRESEEEKALYAVILLIRESWKKIGELKDTKTPEWLKQKLTEYLRGLIEAKYQRYLKHQDLIDKQQTYTAAKANYNAFQANKREEFVREAQDQEINEEQDQEVPA